MAETVQIPRTLNQAVKALGGLDKLLTAREWERSAIVWAFTYEGRNQHGAARESVQHTIREFARLGIAGLSSQDSVRFHRECWREAMERGEAEDAQPGQAVKLPTSPFPANPSVGRTIHEPERRTALTRQAEKDGVGASKVIDVASNPRAVASAMQADPEFAEKVVQHLPSAARRKHINRVWDVEQAEEVAQRDAERGRPMPPPPMRDHGAVGAFLWTETVRKALTPLHQALRMHQTEHIQLDPDHREILMDLLNQIDGAVAQLRMAADGSVTDEEIAEFLANS